MEKKKEVDILFVIPPYHKRNGSGSLFPLGIGAIMACLQQQGLTYSYVDCTQIIDTLFESDLHKLELLLNLELQHYEPVLVGVGPCVTPGIRGLEVVSKCCIKAFGTKRVFAGGPFAMLPSQEWFFYEHLGLSFLIKGDGENAVCAAVKTLKSGKNLKQCGLVSFPGYSYINIIKDLDKMPFPIRVEMDKNFFSDRRQHTSKSIKTAHIVASRGCPYHCSYCVSGNLNIPFRKRSAQNIVDEMHFLLINYGVSDIVFYDDCFFSGVNTIHTEVELFCSALEKSGVEMTWQIEIRPDTIVELNDKELRRLYLLGCRQMNIGIEKTYDDGASVFGKKYNYNKLKEFLNHIHTVAPIKMTGTFILGGSGETKESIRSIIEDSTELNLDDAEYSPLFVYPDTPIYEEVFSNPTSWLDVVLASEEPWGEVVFESNELDKKTLIALVDEAYKFFYRGKKLNNKIRDRYHLKGK